MVDRATSLGGQRRADLTVTGSPTPVGLSPLMELTFPREPFSVSLGAWDSTEDERCRCGDAPSPPAAAPRFFSGGASLTAWAMAVSAAGGRRLLRLYPARFSIAFPGGPGGGGPGFPAIPIWPLPVGGSPIRLAAQPGTTPVGSARGSVGHYGGV